jgi:hypothetical protein
MDMEKCRPAQLPRPGRSTARHEDPVPHARHLDQELDLVVVAYRTVEDRPS